MPQRSDVVHAGSETEARQKSNKFTSTFGAKQEIVHVDEWKGRENLFDLADNSSSRAQVRIFCDDPLSSKPAQVFHSVFSFIIVLSIACYMFGSLNEGGKQDPKNLPKEVYVGMEYVFTSLFTVDLFTRMLVADTWLRKRTHRRKNEDPHPPFFLDPLNYCDFLSVLPMPLEIIFQSSTWLEDMVSIGDMKILGVFRVIRIFKIARHFDGTKVLATTVRRSAKPLFVSIFMLFAFGFVVAGVLYFWEPCFSTSCALRDVFNTGYYIAITLTTVGYGDQVPKTTAGRVIGVFCMIAGSFYMAMPLAVIGSKFEEAYQEHETEKEHRYEDEYEICVVKSLQGVTRRQRKDRARRLGYQVAESLDDVDLVIRRKDDFTKKERQYVFRTLQKRLLQLTLDLRVLFKLETPIKKTKPKFSNPDETEQIPKLESFWDADAADVLFPDDRMLHEVGKDELADLHREREHFYQNIKIAIEKNDCRSKLWLLMEVQGSSRWARWLHNLRLFVTAMSILVCFAETMPEMNDFGEDSRICKQVVGYYCGKTQMTANSETKVLNPGCFGVSDSNMLSMYEHANQIVNQTMFTKYTGCENADINKPENTCSFGSTSSIGFSCSPPARLVKKDNISAAAQAKFEKDLSEINIAHKVEFVLGHALNKNISSYIASKSSVEKAFEIIHEQLDADYASSWNAPFDPAVSHKQFPEDYTPMCERVQCTETHIEGTTHFMNYTDKGETWMIFETIFATFFIFELFLRLATIQNCREWIKSKANMIDVVAIMTTVFEVVYVPYSAGKFSYEVWGNGSLFDPATFRIFRVLVSIRFITMQRHFSGLQVIIKTVQLVKEKIAIPLFFLFIFVTLFAAFFNFFERGTLYTCAGFDGESAMPIDQCRKCKIWKSEGVKGDDLYDGHCQLMVELYTGDGPEMLHPSLMNSVFDAWWTMAVTMTTVGYGVKVPKRSMGKMVAIAAAMVGSFYISMPLTIIGSQFYDIYTQVQEEDEEDEDRLKLLFSRTSNAGHSSGHFALNALSKVKALAAGHRLKRRGDLIDEERVLLTDYITAAGFVNEQAYQSSVERLEQFSALHMKVMCVISAKFYRDFDEGGMKMLDGQA
jgi:hypothetical protein